METLKKYWWVIVALIVAVFAFKKRKTIRRKVKRYSQRRRAMRNRLRSGNWEKKMPTFRGMYAFSRGEKGMSKYESFKAALRAKLKRRRK